MKRYMARSKQCTSYREFLAKQEKLKRFKKGKQWKRLNDKRYAKNY